jgi:tetratricopeptide (TPR) repeat protein
LHLIRKEYDEAVAYYKRALESDPRNAACLNKLGMAYLQLQQFGPALSSFKKSVKADGDFAAAVHNMGVVYHERKQYGKAIRAYSKALTMNPQMAVAYASLGYAYFATKRYPEAMDAFRKAVALDPSVFGHGSSAGSVVQDRTVVDHALFDFLLAKMYAQAGNLERCLFHLKKARDEGYRSLGSVKTDPAFAAVVKEPGVLELIEPPPASTQP